MLSTQKQPIGKASPFNKCYQLSLFHMHAKLIQYGMPLPLILLIIYWNSKAFN